MALSLSRLVVSIILTGAVCACSSTRVKESWVNPEFAGSDLGKTLVIAVYDDELLRSQFETQLAAALGEHSVNAVPRAKVRSLAGKPGRDKAVEAIKSEDFDRVLVTRLAAIRDDEIRHAGYTEYEVAGVRGRFGRYWVTGVNVTEHEPYTEERTRLYVETSLFETNEGLVVWRTRTETTNPQFTDLSSELISAIVGRMRRDGLIN